MRDADLPGIDYRAQLQDRLYNAYMYRYLKWFKDGQVPDSQFGIIFSYYLRRAKHTHESYAALEEIDLPASTIKGVALGHIRPHYRILKEMKLKKKVPVIEPYYIHEDQDE